MLPTAAWGSTLEGTHMCTLAHTAHTHVLNLMVPIFSI